MLGRMEKVWTLWKGAWSKHIFHHHWSITITITKSPFLSGSGHVLLWILLCFASSLSSYPMWAPIKRTVIFHFNIETAILSLSYEKTATNVNCKTWAGLDKARPHGWVIIHIPKTLTSNFMFIFVSS